jgi:hypothetical protein
LKSNLFFDTASDSATVRFQRLTIAGVGEALHEASRWGAEGRDLVVVRCESGARFAEAVVEFFMYFLMFDVEFPEVQLCRSEAWRRVLVGGGERWLDDWRS